MQSGMIALLLLLLWRPAMSVGELNSQQNIIAVVVDDSRSMAIGDADGRTREAAAVAALESGVLAGLQKRFQTRIYQAGQRSRARRKARAVSRPQGLPRISTTVCMQLASETSDLPVGAVILLSDGEQNTLGAGGEGIRRETIQALRNRRIPVHTIGFGREEHSRDVEIEDVSLADSAVADSRVAATVTLTQDGFKGEKVTLTVRDGGKILAAHDIVLGPDGRIQTEPLFFPAGAGRRQESRVQDRAACRGRKHGQQRRQAAVGGERYQAPHSLHRG